MICMCNYCGEEFESPTKRMYCSNECRKMHIDDASKNAITRRVCAECKKIFYGSDVIRFCSNECRGKSMERDRKKIPLSTLGEKLEYCKNVGITYAEYQKMVTLGENDNERD